MICGYEDEDKEAAFHVRLYMSILRWLVFLSERHKEEAPTILVDCFTPTEKERHHLLSWVIKCITCPVDQESIRNLCSDLPETAFMLIGRRLYDKDAWALLELGDTKDGTHPAYVLASLARIPNEPTTCLFLRLPSWEAPTRWPFCYVLSVAGRGLGSAVARARAAGAGTR
jgi:hypothetical protein